MGYRRGEGGHESVDGGVVKYSGTEEIENCLEGGVVEIGEEGTGELRKE